MRKAVPSIVCLALAIFFVAQLSAEDTSPPKGTEVMHADQRATTDVAPWGTVKVLLLNSWGTTSIWEDMNTNWGNFGKRPVTVDDTTYIDSDFTYQNLVQSKADVIVLSNPAGGEKQYSPAEIAAVARYAKEGHTVIGTYIVFQWVNTDNRGLAPIFGLDSKIEYTSSQVGISNLFEKNSWDNTKAKECLFTGIKGNSWQSDGYPYSEAPATGSWSGHLANKTAVADSDSCVGIVSLYSTAKYNGVFISNFPEYNGGTDDEQLLYNAATCYVK